MSHDLPSVRTLTESRKEEKEIDLKQVGGFEGKWRRNFGKDCRGRIPEDNDNLGFGVCNYAYKTHTQV